MADIDCNPFGAESLKDLLEPTVEVPAVLLLAAGCCGGGCCVGRQPRGHVSTNRCCWGVR